MALNVCLMVGVLGIWFARAHAGPTIEVRARPMVQITEVRQLASQRVRIAGQVLDRDTGGPLAATRITIHYGEADSVVTTDSAGGFATEMPQTDVDEARFEVAAAPFVDRVEVKSVIAPEKSALQLRIQAVADHEGAVLTVVPLLDGTPASPPLHLPVLLHIERVSPVPAAERSLATLTTESPTPVTRAAVGGAGTVRVRVSFSGDDIYQPASAEITLDFRVTPQPELKLAAANEPVPFESTVRPQLVVTDGATPLAGLAVTLYAGTRRIDQRRTNAKGRASFAVEAQSLGMGQVGLWARVEADGVIESASSAPVVILVSPPQPLPLRTTLLAFAATATAALLFFALRRHVKWSARPKRVRHTDSADRLTATTTLGKPSLRQRLSAAAQRDFGGTIRDRIRQRPVPDATIHLDAPGGGIALAGNPLGEFATTDLPERAYAVTITAPGYMPYSMRMAVPHRGEFSQVTLELLPVREHAFALYRKIAEPLLPAQQRWGTWSPRQIVQFVRAKQPAPQLAALTDLVEKIYFSQHATAVEHLSDLERLAASALAERAETPISAQRHR